MENAAWIAAEIETKLDLVHDVRVDGRMTAQRALPWVLSCSFRIGLCAIKASAMSCFSVRTGGRFRCINSNRLCLVVSSLFA